MPRDFNIRLNRYRIRSLNFMMKGDEPKEDKIPVKIDMAYSYDYNYKEKSVTSRFSISVLQEEAPFQLEIEYEGSFVLNKRVPKKEFESFGKINCPAMLFPFVRECIAELTRRAGLNPLILPAVNFVELAKKSNAGRGNEETKSEQEIT